MKSDWQWTWGGALFTVAVILVMGPWATRHMEIWDDQSMPSDAEAIEGIGLMLCWWVVLVGLFL